MAEKDTGGSAFPVREWNGPNDQVIWPERGMTLRDWFATVVDKDEYGDILYRNMSGELKDVLAGPAPIEPTNNDTESRSAYRLECLKRELRVRAAVRYLMADAMLAERNK